MNFKIITLFPEIFPGPLNHSITGNALQEKKFSIETIDIKKFSNKHHGLDDSPFGGGAGMVLKPDIMQSSLDQAKKKSCKNSKTIYLSPGGKKINQDLIYEYLKYEELVIICGRYEGIDSRFIEYNEIEELSVGDYILSSGAIASFILIDACVRLIPEVLGNNNSLKSESFQNHLLEYPQYTKPSIWRDISVPDVLLSGNHKDISNWRLKKSIEKTKKIRPDLFKKYIKKDKGGI